MHSKGAGMLSGEKQAAEVEMQKRQCGGKKRKTPKTAYIL
jgi:hypothetical protein